MEVAGNNVFSLEGYPFVETTWLRTSAEKMMNCRLEEVTLQSECPNCTISSPLGDVPGSARGSFQHNLVTLVWDDTWKETKVCQIRIIERGTGVRYSENNSTTFRVRDPLKQLDFLYRPENVSVCTLAKKSSPFRAVEGMDKVVITVELLPSVIPEGEHVTIRIPPGLTSNISTPDDALTVLITRAEIEFASHTQYARDLAMEVSNHLAKEIRNLQCEQRKAAHYAAISTAQYNGWLAASYLGLPICSKLIVVGESASVLRCTPQNRTFEPVFTNCGPQPRSGNATINNEGWELTKFSDCYWHANFVNFNGKAHTFRNNTWAPINPNIVMHGRRLVDSRPLEVDNSFGTLREMHPAIASHPISGSTIMADILAYVQSGYAVNLQGDRQIESIFVHPSEKADVSFVARAGNWLRNFGILSGVGMSVALAFRFCGIGSCLGAYIPCLRYCNPFSWLATMPPPARDVETGREVNRAVGTPVTIVNVLPQIHAESPARLNEVSDVDVLRRYEPRETRVLRQGPMFNRQIEAIPLQTHRR
jgi:hypothetical protein